MKRKLRDLDDFEFMAGFDIQIVWVESISILSDEIRDSRGTNTVLDTVANGEHQSIVNYTFEAFWTCQVINAIFDGRN